MREKRLQFPTIFSETQENCAKNKPMPNNSSGDCSATVALRVKNSAVSIQLIGISLISTATN